METAERPPVLSRAFDGAILLGAAVAIVVALVRSFAEGVPSIGLTWLCVPLIVLIARFPMLLDGGSGGLEVGFDSAVLMFLLCVLPVAQALVLWSVGVVLTQVTSGKRTSSKWFNIGVGVLGGAAGALALSRIRGDSHGTPRELLAVAVAATVYFAADLALSAISVALEQRSSLFRELTQPGLALAVGCFVPFDSLGYLAAVVFRSAPWWTLALLAVPLATLLVATTAVTRDREHARRLSVLFDAAVRMQTALEDSVIQSQISDATRRLLRLKYVELRPTPPSDTEVGAQVHDQDPPLWVVAPRSHRARSTIAADQAALEAMAAVASAAFARVRLTHSMTHLAHHDVLTDLPNRALLMDRIREALARARQRGTSVALLFCDLDGFKPINDRFGHDCGDQVLIEVAGMLATAVRRTDTVARLGGDEFAVLLEDVLTPEVDSTCERLLATLGDGVTVVAERVPLGASIGVAFGSPSDTADDLIRNADIAMYQAKALGKNRYVTYDESLGATRVRRLELLEALRAALAARDLQVAYQPVVEATTGRIIGVEALARWTHDGKPITPDVFIPAAEDNGLIVPLGELVLDLVADDAPALIQAAGGPISIAVNVSAQQLRDAGFVLVVTDVLRRMGESTLILEITERRGLDNDPDCLLTMQQLSEAGVIFAIDDFGIGYSAISYLKDTPISIMKTDASLSAEIDIDERACRLLASITLMGKALGVDVVVEGIERDDQLEHLRTHVDPLYAQGFLLHRPMGLEQVVTAFADQQRGLRDDDLTPTG